MFDDILAELNIELSNSEIQLLASLMFEAYLEKSIAKLNSLSVSFTPTDLRVFSPAEDRKSFMTMYNDVVLKNQNMIDAYNSRDRLTGKRKAVDYTKYYEE